MILRSDLKHIIMFQPKGLLMLSALLLAWIEYVKILAYPFCYVATVDKLDPLHLSIIINLQHSEIAQNTYFLIKDDICLYSTNSIHS